MIKSLRENHFIKKKLKEILSYTSEFLNDSINCQVITSIYQYNFLHFIANNLIIFLVLNPKITQQYFDILH